MRVKLATNLARSINTTGCRRRAPGGPFFSVVPAAIVSLLVSTEAAAFDSYRYLHVTIDTPWAIFLVLLPIILSPFILMAFLYWRFANRRAQQQKQAAPAENDGSGSQQ